MAKRERLREYTRNSVKVKAIQKCFAPGSHAAEDGIRRGSGVYGNYHNSGSELAYRTVKRIHMDSLQAAM